MTERSGLLVSKRRRIAVANLIVLAVGTICFVEVYLPSELQAAPRYQKVETKVTSVKADHTAVSKKEGRKNHRARPALEAEQFRRSVDAKVVKLDDAAIKTLRRLIRVTDDSDPEKPDFYFRLAEHYREKKVSYMFRARSLDERVFQSRTRQQKQKLKKIQVSYEKAERQWMIGAIKLYIKIAKTPAYAKYSRMDEVLFNVADMLNQAKRRDRARIFFSELIRNYPKSPYIPDAYLSFAEYFFEEGRVEEALRRYRQVAEYRDSPLYGYALYKQAWCWLNLEKPRNALDLFVKVIRNGEGWAGTKQSKIVLIREAKKDSVRAYVRTGGTPKRAWAFFRRIGGSYAPQMLERLAMIYDDEGKYDWAIRTYKRLMALQPKSEKLCRWQYNVVRATLSGKQKKDQVVEAKRLAALSASFLTRGASRPSGNDWTKITRSCRDKAAGTLRELATNWHNEAQKTQDESTYALARYLYREYLDNFPKEKDSYKMAFYYAELLFRLQKWSDAAEAYTRVVAMKAKGTHRKEAAYAAVISWKNALDVEEEVKDTEVIKPGEKLKPVPISEKSKQMLAAFDSYLKQVPDAKERPAIMYRKARVYYEANHFAEAATLFEDVVNQYPDNNLAVYSANLMLNSLEHLKRYDDIAKWVGRLRKMPKLAQGDLKETLDRVWAGLELKRVQSHKEAGRYRSCGDGYVRLAAERPDDERWPQMAYNAAICYEAAKLIGAAIKIRRKLIEVNPKHELAQKSMHLIGANYHALAWFGKAADWYERYAKEFPGEENAPEALQNAIVFRLGRAEYAQADKDIRFFAATYGRRPKYSARGADVVFAGAVASENRGNPAATIGEYKSYLKKWGKYGGLQRKIVAHVKIAQALWKASCPVRGVNGACLKVGRVRSKRRVKSERKSLRRGQRKQCGPATKNRVVVVKRNSSKMAEAKRSIRKAIALGRRLGKSSSRQGASIISDRARRTRESNFALAQAYFLIAEAAYEEFLRLEFPKNLDFSDRNKAKKKSSVKRFRRYRDRKSRLLTKARSAYQTVIGRKVEHWSIAAAARIGQLFQNFSDALYTASVPSPTIPKSLRSRAAKREFLTVFTDAYCDALEDKARPLEEKAIQGLAACLNRSTELSWYNEWSELCEAELNQIRPAEYPIAAELRAEPGYISMKPDRAELVRDVAR